MSAKWLRYSRLSLLSLVGVLLLWIGLIPPAQSHWADLSVAEVVVGKTETQITLTFPTGLVAFADNNRDGQLSLAEVHTHEARLQDFLSQQIRLTNPENSNGRLTIKPLEQVALPSTVRVTPNTHSTLLLTYAWPQPIQGLAIHYDLFLPGVSTASCLATILHAGQSRTFVFTPEKRQFSLVQSSTGLSSRGLIAIAGSFVWGATHALSPGHGKTIVGAYLVGARATAQQALFLGLSTTITHTTGVFVLGLITLFASHFILPEQLYPWLSFLSGLMVVAIGLNLFMSRLRSVQFRKLPWGHSHANHQGNGNHSHDHHHDHDHHHSHGYHHHDHLPPGTDGSPVTWCSLLALGISGGLVPCPAAMVLLLSTVALGHIGFGLVLVSAFSLGLAGVLTGLGLLLVSAKRLFERLPTKGRLLRVLPTVSALFVVLIGLGVTAQALVQIGLIRLQIALQ